ncbi:tyrosine-protein phosphatase [Lebetimonas sp. JH292]|uniref:tyrosine-protein phosphatase n=1 Tax=Lebetimonas sp. JH292 TaxID=990068 RepID=UPI00046649F0|nr:tyrosine-protein phosphatase [Lebetimonas sp. JH292]
MKNLVKFLFLIFWSILVLVVMWLGVIRQVGNFHKVADGIYRSAQLYEYDFPKYYKKYRFKTIINLRGAHPDKDWYKYEIKFCKDHNITHIDFQMSDKEFQSPKKINEVLKIIKDAKKPVLIHCRAGADRTGLVSAAYLYLIGEKNNSMLSIKYGHFPYLGSPTKAMDESYKKWKMSANEQSKLWKMLNDK